MKFYKKLALSLAAVTLVSFSACEAKKEENPPVAESPSPSEAQPSETASEAPSVDLIKIGGIGPLSGQNSVYGIAATNGAELAISELETLLGAKVEFIKVDDNSDPLEAVNAYNRLVNNDKVTAIIGAVTSGPSSSIAAVAKDIGTPIISPSGTAVDVTTYGENMFRACFIDPFQGEVMANFAYNKIEKKTASIIYNTNSDYSVGLAESFKTTFEANGGQILENEGYAEADIDFKAQLTKIANSKPDVLFIPEYYAKVALMAKQIKDLNIDAVLLGADGWDGVLDIISDPTLVDGAYFCNHYSSQDPDPMVQDFIKKYTDKFGEAPNSFAALGYDAAKIMIQAIETAGSTDSAAIVEALKNTDITSVTGKITFDENRNPIKPATILRIEEGNLAMFDRLNP